MKVKAISLFISCIEMCLYLSIVYFRLLPTVYIRKNRYMLQYACSNAIDTRDQLFQVAYIYRYILFQKNSTNLELVKSNKKSHFSFM